MALKLRSADLYSIIVSGQLNRDETYYAYNALDSAVTLRVHEKLAEAIRAKNVPHHKASYDFVRAMQGPAMAMMLRGVAINHKVRQDETERYTHIREQAQHRLDQLADAVWGPEHYTTKTKTKELYTPIGKRGLPLTPRERVVVVEEPAVRPRGLNSASSKQVLAFFNIALGLPVEYEIRKTPTGSERTPSANDKALRKWAGVLLKGLGVDRFDRSVPKVHLAKPFVELILAIRDADKMLGVLRTRLDPDGRMHCSYNVVGTESGRWSSSKSAFGRGTNLQNITPTMRRMFCADDDWRMVSTDLEQAESRVVAGLVWQATGDRAYLDACLSSDLHTAVVRMAWPQLDWTDDHIHNRAIADGPCDLHPSYTYRDIAKRIGHGSNYGGTPYGIAQAVGIPARVVEAFQTLYFRAFPAIRDWHENVRSQLLSDQILDTPPLRRRYFFSRPNEDSTLREAIAFVPQSTVAELLNLIMLRCWLRSLKWRGLPTDPEDALPIQLLLQNHDAFLFQTPENVHLPTIISAVNAEFNRATIPFVRGDERLDLSIPGEFVTGWNWGYKDNDPDKSKWHFMDGNPDGLTKWKGRDDRRRVQGARTTPAEWLSGQVSRVY